MNLRFTEPGSAGKLLLSKNSLTKGVFMKVISICFILTILCLTITARDLNSQDIDDKKIILELNNATLTDFVKNIRNLTGFSTVVGNLKTTRPINLSRAERTIRQTLDEALENSGITWRVDKTTIIFKKRNTEGKIADVSLAPELATLVTGTVRSNQQEPLAGVNVIVKNSTKGTTTDKDGNFAIEAASSDILVFSFIGFKVTEIPVGAQTAIHVILIEDVKSLQEVQVIGTTYWSTTKERSTSSIAKVTSEEIGKQPVTSPLMSLQGRLAGVDVMPNTGVPGSAPKIQIRGRNSLRTGGNLDNLVNGNLPLYIIDGVPVDSRPISANSSSLVGDGFDPLSTINVSNIESIEVLKDADATSIYGSRGANGVIVITTKSGRYQKRGSLDVSLYLGAGRITNTMKLLNTQQYLEMRREAFKNDQKNGEMFSTPGSLNPDFDLLKWDTTRYTDWQKELLGKTSQISETQISWSGGNESTSFRIGGAYHKEGLVFPGDFGYQRGNVSLNMNHLSPDKRLAASVSINYGVENNKLFDNAEVMQMALTLPPNAPALYDSVGAINWEGNTWQNPIASLRHTHESKTKNLVSNINFSYKFLKNLTAKANIGYTKLEGSELSLHPLSAYAPVVMQYYTGTAAIGSNNRESWIAEPQIIFSTRSNHGNSFDVILGSTFQGYTFSSQLLTATGYTSDALIRDLKAATNTTYDRNDGSNYRYIALFSRISYGLKDKYFINISARRDGSSRFGVNNRFGNFGSLGVAWIFSKERFIENQSVLSFGKIRASYGTSGNDQIGDYQYYNAYKVDVYKYQNSPTLQPVALYNPDFKWEVTKKLETAIEVSLFQNKIVLEIAYYLNHSSNQLIQYTLPASTGFPTVMSNINALIENRGFETSFTSTNVSTDKLTWQTSFNITVPRNKLVSFPGFNDSPYSKMYVVGLPISIQRLYTATGVNKETGYYEMKDENNDGQINEEDQLFYKDFGRQVYGGVTNTLRFKRVELSALMQYAQQDAFNYTASWPGANVNQPVTVLDRWQTPGDNAPNQFFSQSVFGGSINKFAQYSSSSANVGRADFIRLKTVTISYAFSPSILSKLKLTTCLLYLQGQNLWTYTNYKGLDPETKNALPPLRTITAGIQVKL